MTSPAYSIVYSAVTSGSSGSGAAGTVLIPDSSSGLYVPATTAARGTRRSTGVALTTYANGSAVEIQQQGLISATVSGLGAGTASWVRCSATGTLERCTPSGSDDIVGYCETDGTFHAAFGYLTATLVNGGGGSITFAGDLSGNSSSQTVEKVKGTTITTAGGALAVGAVLRTTAVGTADWGAVNLADTDAVTGTLPVANGGTGITSLGSGVATFLGTPSSANLAAAVTDETGSGALVFANTPTLVTPVIGAATGTSAALSSFWSTGADPATTGAGRMSLNSYIYFKATDATNRILIGASSSSPDTVVVGASGASGYNLQLCGDSISIRNSAATIPYAVFNGTSFRIDSDVAPLWLTDTDGHDFKFVCSNIAADRNVTLPVLTGNDTFVFEAHAATLTNKTISLTSNTLTCTSAELATALSDETGTGVAVFGTSPTFTTSISVGTAPFAAAGLVRVPVASRIIATRDAGDAADYVALASGAGAELYLGSSASFADRFSGVNIYPGSSVAIGLSSTTHLYVVSGATQAWQPITGSSIGNSPYGAHGGVAHTFAADTNYTVTAAQYALDWLEFVTGSITAGRTVTFPHPASKAVGYYKTFFNNTNQTLTVSTGTGTTKTITTGLAQRFWFDNAGVSFAGPTFTP